jgi:hypothetical protein
MTIPLPPRFDASVPVEEEFLTPPIWVASNPPPVFERVEMKRTMSEVSNWAGDDDDEDDDDEGSTSSEQLGQEDCTDILKENVKLQKDVILMLVATTDKVTRTPSTDLFQF